MTDMEPTRRLDVCGMTAGRLWAWVHGEEDDPRAAKEIEDHVATCAACRAHVAEMREILDDLASLGGNDGFVEPPLPESLGSYRIVRRIGRGGMGVVYEAEQRQPRRRVALKVILGGQHIDDVQVRLFQREVQTLARLNHPSIATIYEAGRTDEGQDFFAMEYVQGTDLLAYAHGGGDKGLSLSERLRLFERICDAISYAHQRGVIHRDLKPSNILVDEQGAAKILDFGLARVIAPDVTAASLHTESGRIMGTLPYMSPEQVEGRSDDIDVRTDVYTLGVILYELATGRRPYDVGATSLVGAVRIICEMPPAHPRRMDRTLPDDVATIILKALEKDPARRYQSAAALGEDVHRYLTGHTILARPPSTLYQLRKFAARHKVPTALGGLLLASIAAGGVVSLVQANRLAAEARKTTRINEVLTDLYASADFQRTGRSDITVLEALSAKAAELEVQLADEPLVAASVRNTIGNLYAGHGKYDLAGRHLSFALETRLAAHGETHVDTAESLNDLGELRYAQRRLDEAESLFERSLRARRLALPADDERIAETLNNLGALLRRRGEEAHDPTLLARSRVHLGDALAIRQRIFDHARASGDGVGNRRAKAFNNLAQTLNNLGGLRKSEALLEQDPDRRRAAFMEADGYYRRSLDLRRESLGPEHYEVGKLYNNLASLCQEMQQPARAEEYYRLALPILWAPSALGAEHPQIASVLHGLAEVLLAQGELTDAEATCRQAVVMRQKLLGRDAAPAQASMQLLESILAATSLNEAGNADQYPGQ